MILDGKYVTDPMVAPLIVTSDVPAKQHQANINLLNHLRHPRSVKTIANLQRQIDELRTSK